VSKVKLPACLFFSFFGGIPLGEPKKENKGDKKHYVS